MASTGNAAKAAHFLWNAQRARETYRNLPDEIAPRDTQEAYAAQTAFHALASPSRGAVAGMKIATTTKVMQALMGIDHPCGGGIFAHTIHQSPVLLRCADFVNLRIECEIAVRLGADMTDGRFTPSSVRSLVAEAMPAFELIEDRNAVYRETKALSMIADNCWNAGIVIGQPVAFEGSFDIDALQGNLTINGKSVADGKADRPLEALAWLANLAIERGHPIRKGMVVITGSVVATVSVAPGDVAVFAIDGLGKTRLELA